MRVSWSEIEAFMECQKKHQFRYTLGFKPHKVGKGRMLGTLVHEMVDRVWEGGFWREHAVEFVAANDTAYDAGLPSALEPEAAEAIANQALYLVERYAEVAVRPADVEVVIGPHAFMEVPFKVSAQACVFVFVVDRLLRWQDRLFVHEVKTMREWGREELLGRDGQLTAYTWALRQLGYPVEDALFDAIKTYEYKNARPAIDSVRRVITNRSAMELRTFERDLIAATAQIIAVRSHGQMTRNVRQDCRYCDFLGPCQEEQFGGDPQALLHEHYRRKSAKTLVRGPAS